jgi:PAS domain S-box-containing protein
MRNRTLFETIFESAPDAVIVINEHGKILLSNHQAKNLFGYETEEFLGMEIEALIPDSYRQQHRNHRNNYAKNPRTREMANHSLELRACRKDQSEFYVEISLSPVTIDGKLYVSAAIRDVTEKKEMVNQLKKQQQLLSLHNDRLMNFAYIVSHNLRSHSGNFRIMLELLEKAESLKDKKEIMTHLKAISNGLSNTVGQLSETLIQVDNQSTREPIGLRHYIEKTSEILSGEISAVRGQLINNVSKDLKLHYDPTYMESILLNFISNAIKYRHPERNPVITIDAVQSNGSLLLQIQDNGVGIDLTKHGETLFGLRKTFHGNKDAHGVGLFITKNQIESQGGKIEVQSEVGKGTIFKVFFDLAARPATS